MLNLVNFIYRNIVGEQDSHHTPSDKLVYLDASMNMVRTLLGKNEQSVIILDNILQKDHVCEKLQKYMDAYNDSMMSGGPTDELNELIVGIDHDRVVMLNRISNMIDALND